jgi:quercetin dioxygenase-like cupin family protein
VRNPTLSTLQSLAGALRIPLATLLAESAGATVASPGIEARLVDVSHEAGHTIEVYRLRLYPGVTHRSGPHGPGVIEHLLVTAGRARVGREGAQSEIGPGQAAAWPSDAPHSYQGLGDMPTESVLVIRTPDLAPG